MPVGCELRFNLKSQKAKIVMKANKKIFDRNGICEIYFGDFFYNWYFVNENPTTIEKQYPANIEKLKELKNEKNLRFDPSFVRVILSHLIDLSHSHLKGGTGG